MLSVGISGGIGSGKTLVCTIFQVLGILKSVFWLNPGTEFGDGVYETKFS